MNGLSGLLVHIVADIIRAYDSAIIRHLATEGLRCAGGWHVYGVISRAHPLWLVRVVCNLVSIPGMAHPAAG